MRSAIGVVVSLYLDENPCAQVDRPKAGKKHPSALTEAEVDRLLIFIEHHVETCPDITNRPANQLWHRDAFDLMAGTGLRPAELRRLRWGDIEWPATASGAVILPGAIHVRGRDGEQTKTGEERSVTMLPRTRRRLDYLQRETRRSSDPDEHVLKGSTGIGPINQKYLSNRFRYFRSKAGLPSRYWLYSLRHFFATELARRGLSGVMLRGEMGHKSYATTEWYLHLAAAERHRATYALFAEEEAPNPATEPNRILERILAR